MYPLNAKVKINPKSMFRQQGNEVGTVINVYPGHVEFKYYVEWANGFRYNYREKDLLSAKEETIRLLLQEIDSL